MNSKRQFGTIFFKYTFQYLTEDKSVASWFKQKVRFATDSNK
jgi:hypothetical protein